MALSKLEKETIITYNEAEAEAEIYTYNRPLQRKLEKLAQERPEEVKILCADKTGSKTFRLPKKFVTVRASRQISPELREEMAQVAKERFSNHQGKEE